MEQIGGIILAGGKSSRMGKDKVFLSYQGKMLIQHSLDLAQAVCAQVLISANGQGFDRFHLPIVRDEIGGCGPIGGIYSTLKHADLGWNFVLSCDTPFVSREVVERLIMNIADFDCIVPIHGSLKEPLVALYHKKANPKIKKFISKGVFKLKVLVTELNTKLVDVSDLVEKDPKLFQNFNFPDDLNFSPVH